MVTLPPPYSPLRDLALEGRVLQRVVLGVHGEVVHRRVVGDALGQRPGDQHAVALQPEVPVQPAGVVLLHHEACPPPPGLPRFPVVSGGTGSGVRVASRLLRYSASRSTPREYPLRPVFYQRWCVAYEESVMVSVSSGGSYTDWTATRPGPWSLTQMFR